jgi:hypothetical protein
MTKKKNASPGKSYPDRVTRIQLLYRLSYTASSFLRHKTKYILVTYIWGIRNLLFHMIM